MDHFEILEKKITFIGSIMVITQESFIAILAKCN